MRNISLYIAQRYLISKKGNTAVTFITWLAVFAMTTAVGAMFIILSVFSGLEDLNKEMIANLHEDISILPRRGKVLQNIKKVEALLKKNSDIKSFSRLIEEKVYVSYNDSGEIGYLRGVDSAYTITNPIDHKIFFGQYPSFIYKNEAVLGSGLDSRLAIPVGESAPSFTLMMPKVGSGIVRKQEDIFTKKEVYATGVFISNDQLDNYIIAPLELAQELLELSSDEAYQIVIKLKNDQMARKVKNILKKSLNDDYILKTKEEQNAAFWKMINTEKLMIYLIFSLVIFITTFNLAGAIIILQLDKKKQAKSLLSLGLSLRELRGVYFYTGVLIVSLGAVLGLSIGTFICYFQLTTGFFKANAVLPFPLRLSIYNYLIVSAVTFLLGILVSAVFSRVHKEYLSDK
ncbi:MAG: ABC transporter permease [Bergeyella sp.]|nr:ABC transporter permease [Bergeyella sp.]